MKSFGETPRPLRTCFLWPDCEPAGEWVVFGGTIARGLFDLNIPELATDQLTEPPTFTVEQSGGPP